MKHVVLTGFMASGKTAVGRRLAKRLDRSFIDTDRLIEEEAGRSIPEIFSASGEAAFRDLEHEVVCGLAERLKRPSIVSTGGGTFVAERNRAPLHALGVVVCLVVGIQTILDRIGRSSGSRPLAEGPDAAERLGALLDERMPAYRQADVLVETDGLSVEGATARVLSMIEPRLKGSRRGASRASRSRAAKAKKKPGANE